MTLSIRNLLIFLVLLAVASWWLLRSDPEAEVRHAHDELIRLVNRTPDESGGVALLSARALQSLFAPTILVIGDAEVMAGTYTPEQIVATIFRMSALVDSIDLTISELAVEFPADDEAVTRFSAVLMGRSGIEGREQIAETRSVVSLMRKIEGDWLFAEFRLTQPRDD